MKILKLLIMIEKSEKEKYQQILRKIIELIESLNGQLI